MEFVFINEPEDSLKKECAKNKTKYYVLKNRNSNPFSYMTKLAKIINDNQYDIVHIHGNSRTLITELIVCYTCRINSRITHAHSTSTKYRRLHKSLKKPFERLTRNNLAVSEDAGKFLFSKQDFYVLPNGINVEKYKYNKSIRTNLRKKLGIPDNEIVIGHVGTLTKNKNQEYLVNLIDEISDTKYRLLLIGEGANRASLENLILTKGLNGQVMLLGNQNNVNEWLNVFDFFVFPSFTEGLGLAVIEAQANGLKCYISNTLPSEINVTGEVETFDLSAPVKFLAEKIKKSQPRNLENDAMYSKVFNSEFNIKNAVKKLERYYDSIG